MFLSFLLPPPVPFSYWTPKMLSFDFIKLGKKLEAFFLGKLTYPTEKTSEIILGVSWWESLTPHSITLWQGPQTGKCVPRNRVPSNIFFKIKQPETTRQERDVLAWKAENEQTEKKETKRKQR